MSVSVSESIYRLVPENRERMVTVRADAESREVASLVALSQKGDVEAFAGLLDRFERRVFHFVMRMTRQAQDAEDITQMTFVKVWKNLHRFRSEHAFSTWVFTIARRTALNHIRGTRPTVELGAHDEAVTDTPARQSERREHAESVWNTARRLKPAQYEALWLRYGEGFAVNEIARVMGTNTVRVRVLLHRARKRMAELLTKKEI